MGCSLPGSDVHGFSKQEYCSGLHSLPQGDLPDPGIEPKSPSLQADSLHSLNHQGNPCCHKHTYKCNKTVSRDTSVFVNVQKNVYNTLESDNWFVWDRIVAGVEENTMFVQWSDILQLQ